MTYMNTPSNENQTPLTEAEQETETSPAEAPAEADDPDQRLMQFLDNTDDTAKPTEDPFYAPLPAITIDEDGEDSVKDDSETEDSCQTEKTEPSSDADGETVYVSEQSLKEQETEHPATTDAASAEERTSSDKIKTGKPIWKKFAMPSPSCRTLF